MKMLKNSLVFMFLLSALTASAQVSGNVAYRNNNEYGNNGGQTHSPKNSISVSGSDFIVSTSILINVKPDIMVVTLGLNQEEKTVEACNTAINKRIDGFRQKVKSLGIKAQDVYVDFISQTRIYDYKADAATAVQYAAGFEIKKNIIIRLTNVKAFDVLTTAAAQFEIYDLVKAEYINEDTEAITAQLFDEALKSIEAKKLKYTKAFNIAITDDFNLADDNYYSIQPKTQYREYKAFETSEVYSYNNDTHYIKTEQRKNHTFYYQGAETSGFDKVINPTDPEVCLQYVVEMKVVYHIKR
jgi:uncharacterized protein YggE